MSKQFYDSKEIFVEYTGYTKPLTYDEWMDQPDGSKAVLLYIQFFNEILTAYYKLYATYPYMDEEESVETVLQYLVKNVDKIKQSSRKFKAGYIYTVAYNCLYCISHDRVVAREKYFKESSNIIESEEGTELDLFDVLSGGKDVAEMFEDDVEIRVKEYLWKTVFEECTENAQEVVRRMFGLPKTKRFRSGEEAAAMDELREKLEVYKAYFGMSASV